MEICEAPILIPAADLKKWRGKIGASPNAVVLFFFNSSPRATTDTDRDRDRRKRERCLLVQQSKP